MRKVPKTGSLSGLGRLGEVCPTLRLAKLKAAQGSSGQLRNPADHANGDRLDPSHIIDWCMEQ